MHEEAKKFIPNGKGGFAQMPHEAHPSEAMQKLNEQSKDAVGKTHIRRPL
jgi:phage gp16-like protein